MISFDTAAEALPMYGLGVDSPHKANAVYLRRWHLAQKAELEAAAQAAARSPDAPRDTAWAPIFSRVRDQPGAVR